MGKNSTQMCSTVAPTSRAFDMEARLRSRDCVFHCRRNSIMMRALSNRSATISLASRAASRLRSPFWSPDVEVVPFHRCRCYSRRDQNRDRQTRLAPAEPIFFHSQQGHRGRSEARFRIPSRAHISKSCERRPLMAPVHQNDNGKSEGME